MASRPDAVRPVDVHGSLRFDGPGGQALALVADGGSLRLRLPHARSIRDFAPRSLRGRLNVVRRIAGMLATHGLTLRLEADGESLLWLGHDASPNWLARLLGLGPAHVPFPALRAMVSWPWVGSSS